MILLLHHKWPYLIKKRFLLHFSSSYLIKLSLLYFLIFIGPYSHCLLVNFLSVFEIFYPHYDCLTKFGDFLNETSKMISNERILN